MMSKSFAVVVFIVGVLVRHGGSSGVVSCPLNNIFSTGDYNVNLTELRGEWETVSIEETEINQDITMDRFFNISLVGTFQSGQCKGHHICYTETFDSFYVMGRSGSCKYHSEGRVISLIFDYENTFGSGNVTVTLVCGSSLGVPEVLEGDPRTHAIEILWITSAACKREKDDSKPKETKCYELQHTIDKEKGIEAEFIDLSGLIKDTGYEATMADRPDVIMNVSICRPMKSDDDCSGSMACLYQGDSHLNVTGHNVPLPLGFISSTSRQSYPHYESGVLTVIFPIKKENVNCNGGSAFVKLRFFCPKGDETLGPYIEYLDNNLCVVIVAWNTMHACDIKTIQSTGLTLTTPQGTSFDLQGLPEVTITDTGNGETYYYTVHPSKTGSLNQGCQEDNTDPIHVTQTQNGSAVCRSLGEGAGKLRYVDNILTLTYGGGDTCHNGFARTSIITFICPNDVVGGGNRCNAKNASKCVTFTFESHCLYEFEWVTDLACGTSTPTSTCRFKLNGIDYNLGLLTEDYSSTYAAITSDHSTECYLINPCGNVEVTVLSNLTSASYCNQKVAPQQYCDQSSVCRIPKSSGSKPDSFGSFHLDDSSLLNTVVRDVISVATRPHKSGGTKHQAVIHYICQTGTLLTSPVFISRDQDSIAEFHWYTFAACPQGVSVGSDCTVTQPSTGFTFNLTSISDRIFNFTDKLHNYDYSLRVCKAFAKDTFKDSCSSDSAVCQHAGSHHNSAGMPNSTLIYEDSVIKLNYLRGKKCSNGERHSTIVFFCNPDAHRPKIQNVTEIQHCSYVIEMETKLACPPAYRSSECVFFKSSGDSYDLTQLERTEGNWQAEGADGSVYLINVCRPLNLQGISHCNPLSAVCRKSITSGSVPSQDLGLASTASFGPPPKSADSRVTLVLNYTYPLNSDSGCPKIYSSIQFVCNRTASLNAGPRHLSGGGSADPCEYLFLWETRVVCPVEREVVRACNITDHVTGYTFDLQPLKTHNNNLYTVEGVQGTKKISFNLTLCDILTKESSACSGEKISVCQTDSNGHHHSSGSYTGMNLTYIEENLILTYTGGESCSKGDSRTTEIDFLCDRSLGDDYFGHPKFVSESSHCHYLFEWPTALACPPTTLTCLAGGGKYNLQPLLETRNWYVSGIGGLMYVIGGCQSIDASSIPECAFSVDVGACLYTPSSGKKGYILGYVTGDLVEVSEGHLRLSYHNGRMCPSGIRSVVNIHFHCKAGGGAGNPVLDSGGCVTEITWDTQYACPQDNTTSGWIITNPSSGQTYDLTKLSPVLSSQHAGYNYTVGLAGHTVPCGGEKDVTICQTSVSSNHHFVIARKGGVLELVGGKVQLTSQNGDQCHHHGQIKRMATIYFEYDPRDDFLLALPEQACEYSFVVYTKLVKEEQQQIGVQCYLESFPDLEWFTSFPTPPLLVESGDAKVYFSVCNPISSRNQEANDGFDTCSNTAGACYVKGSKVINLGRPSSHYPPTVSPSGNAVLISYVGGDQCKNGKKKFTTKILLVCSNSTGKVPEVTYFNTTACEVVITWPNPHACPLQVPMTKVSDSVCKILDPSDGTTLDLQPLTDGIQVKSADENYIIGLCGPIRGGPEACNNDRVGVCHHSEGKWMKMSDANHSLTIVSHSPHALDVLYPTGESCGNHMTWTIKVHIYCSHKNNSKKPFVESSNGCELSFTWPTSALCLTEVEGCYVQYPDGTVLDLEPLVSQSWKGDYLGEGKKLGEFNVSICRNLNPTSGEGRHCFPGPAGICFQPDVDKESYKSLGYMITRPSLSPSGQITLKYEKGDGCGTSGGNISTTVNLKCPDNDFESAPQLLKSSDCQYIIEWSTSAACKQNKEESGSCVVDDLHSSFQYNFNSLAKQFQFQDSSGSYSVCLCPKKGSCSTGIKNNTGNHTVSLGTFSKLVVYPNAAPQVEFVGGDKCSGVSTYSSTVFMFCDRGISDEKGRFVHQKDLSTSCHKFFTWWTPVACTSPQISCVIQKPFFDFTPLYPANGSWQVKDEKINDVYLINICGPIHNQDSTSCSGDAAVCVHKHDGSYQDIGFANTQTITINSNQNPEVHFKGPGKCETGSHSSVVIEMICGLRGLKFTKYEHCVYRFDWYTTFACKETNNLHTQRRCDDYSNQEYSYFPKRLVPSTDGAYHVNSRDGGQYHVSLCGNTPQKCGDGVGACYTDKNNNKLLQLGTKNNLLITFDSYLMRFNMTGRDGSVIFTVDCDQSNQKRSPTELETMILENEFTTSTKRTVYFRMYTSKGCRFDSSKVPTENPPSSSPNTGPTSKKSSNGSSMTFAIVIIFLVILLIIVIIAAFVLWNRDRREYIFKRLSSIFAVKADEPVRYIRARTTDAEASLLEESSSDEEPITAAKTMNDTREEEREKDRAHTGKNGQAMRLKKRKKKEEPLLVDYKDEEEHLSDEELLNI